MRFEYEISYAPPAPFIPVRISPFAHPDHAVSFPAKIDTGSDITAIPEAVVTQLGLREKDRLTVSGFDNQLAEIPEYAIRLELPSGPRGHVDVIVIQADYVLLGRDVLNLLRLLLDGPALTLEILEAANR